MEKKKRVIWNHIPLNDVFTERGKKWKASWQMDCEQNLVSGENFTDSRTITLFFLLDVSQLPPWWLIMQSRLSVAEPRERVWNPKEQLCQVNVHRKICHLRFRCRCSRFHIHSTDNGAAPPHLHGRDGVAFERLARLSEGEKRYYLSSAAVYQTPDEVASSTHQLSHQLEQAKGMTFLQFIRIFFIMARTSRKQIGVDVLSELSFSCHLPSPAGSSRRFPPINGFFSHLNKEGDGFVWYSAVDAGCQMLPSTRLCSSACSFVSYNVWDVKCNTQSDGGSRIGCHSRLKCDCGAPRRVVLDRPRPQRCQGNPLTIWRRCCRGGWRKFGSGQKQTSNSLLCVCECVLVWINWMFDTRLLDYHSIRET